MTFAFDKAIIGLERSCSSNNCPSFRARSVHNVNVIVSLL